MMCWTSAGNTEALITCTSTSCRPETFTSNVRQLEWQPRVWVHCMAAGSQVRFSESQVALLTLIFVPQAVW